MQLKRLKSQVIEGTDLFLPVTPRAKNCLIKEGVAEEKIQVLPMGVDLSRFVFLPQKKNPPKARKLNIIQLLFVGRIEEQKGIMTFVEALAYIALDVVWELTVVGSGSFTSEVHKRIAQLGFNKRVSFIPFVPYDRMPAVFEDKDMLIFPSKTMENWEEQYGMVVLEAMARGVPIITTRSGAIPEVVGDSAVLVREDDSPKLAQVITALAHDVQKRGKLAKSGRLRVKKLYDSKKVANKILNLYATLLA